MGFSKKRLKLVEEFNWKKIDKCPIARILSKKIHGIY